MTIEMVEKVQRLALACGFFARLDALQDGTRIVLVDDRGVDNDATLRLFLARVYAVIRERGKWYSFHEQWEGDYRFVGNPDTLYDFLHDLPGQVDAALAVLEA